MSLHEFKASRLGSCLAPILESGDAVQRMEAKSAAGRPAVEAIGKDIATRVGQLGDEDKKMVGRWVKELLAPRGWRPDRKARVAPGHFFARGTIYRRAMPVAARGDGPARLAAAQALVRALPHPVMSSDELIAERRREFEAER